MDKKSKSPIRNFKDLEVYKNSYDASLKVIKQIVPRLPAEEKFDLADQLRRSSKAVPRLIAEGYSKRHQVKGFQRYLDDALAESNETIVSLNHAKDLYENNIDAKLTKELIDCYDILSKQIYNLAKSWKTFTVR